MTLLLEERPPAQSEVIPPHTGPKCPFYGFSNSGLPFLLDTEGGNACGLVCKRHAPCHMEATGKSPDWDQCAAFNTVMNRPKLDRLMREYTILPKSCWPEGRKTWGGMNLRIWFEHVMGRPYA